MPKSVILTDKAGIPHGTAEIVSAHTGSGSLHKAFSVYVFTKGKREMLIQQRSPVKMLWPGIWANTCCSHPYEGEAAIDAGRRRLKEELGIKAELTEHSSFVYRAEDEPRGVEHEHLTILVAELPEKIEPKPDPAEVQDWKWVTIEEILSDMEANPDTYAPWFHLGLRQILGTKSEIV